MVNYKSSGKPSNNRFKEIYDDFIMQHIDIMTKLMNENIIINEDIERDVLKKLLDHCFSDNIKETVAYSVLNEIYDVSFQLPDDILMESINKVGFGMNKKLIPLCSYAKVNEVKVTVHMPKL